MYHTFFKKNCVKRHFQVLWRWGVTGVYSPGFYCFQPNFTQPGLGLEANLTCYPRWSATVVHWLDGNWCDEIKRLVTPIQLVCISFRLVLHSGTVGFIFPLFSRTLLLFHAIRSSRFTYTLRLHFATHVSLNAWRNTGRTRQAETLAWLSL